MKPNLLNFAKTDKSILHRGHANAHPCEQTVLKKCRGGSLTQAVAAMLGNTMADVQQRLRPRCREMILTMAVAAILGDAVRQRP